MILLYRLILLVVIGTSIKEACAQFREDVQYVDESCKAEGETCSRVGPASGRCCTDSNLVCFRAKDAPEKQCHFFLEWKDRFKVDKNGNRLAYPAVKED